MKRSRGDVSVLSVNDLSGDGSRAIERIQPTDFRQSPHHTIHKCQIDTAVSMLQEVFC